MCASFCSQFNDTHLWKEVAEQLVVAMAGASALSSTGVGGHELYSHTDARGRLRYRCLTVSSVSVRPVRTQALCAIKSGAWNCSVRRSPLPLSFQGKVTPSVVHKMRTTPSSDEPGLVDNTTVTFQILEEEVLEGFSFQHGEMNNAGIKIHFVEAGNPVGKLVLLVHGWPNLWFVWKNQIQPLAEAGYHVIAPDLRGYNISSKPETLEGYGRSAVLSDLVQLIDKFGAGKPASLVGHDWGGFISWGLVEDYPSKVERLVTTNAARMIDFQRILSSNFRQLLKSWYIGFYQIPVIPEWCLAYDNMRFIRNLKNIAPAATDEDVRRHVAAFSNPGTIKGSISYYRAAARGLWNREDGTVPVVEIPVTVIWGDQDPFLLPTVANTDRAKAPNFKIVHLSKSGHWPMWDEPILFNGLLLEAISGDGGDVIE